MEASFASGSFLVQASRSCTTSFLSSHSIALVSACYTPLFHKQIFCHNSLAQKSSSHLYPPQLRRFSVKSMEISGPGSIDSALMVSMQAKLKEQLKTQEVIVKDAYGDGRHVSIDVVSSEFEGKSSMNRQRMVYQAIWEEMQTTVHAVDSMRTRTPAEAAQEK